MDNNVKQIKNKINQNLKLDFLFEYSVWKITKIWLTKEVHHSYQSDIDIAHKIN